MAITVIHGPPATGKTFHAARFRQQYCCSRVLDGWSTADERQPRDGDLILSNDSRHEIAARLPRVTIVDIDTARRRVGLSRAPRGGFRP